MSFEAPLVLKIPRLRGYRVLLVHPNERSALGTVESLFRSLLTPRGDLVGVHGPKPGSGRHDGEFWEHGAWFLKTRGARVFTSEEAAVRAFAQLSAVKLRLGVLAPARSIVALVSGCDRPSFEVWTIAPRLTTIREHLSSAHLSSDLPGLQRNLVAYAHCLGLALESAFTTGLSLDANPANFAAQGGRARYIDDDVVERGDAIGIEDAFLARFHEYRDAPAPLLDAYLERFVSELLLRREALGSLERFCERLSLAAQFRRGTEPWASAAIKRLEGD